MAVPLYEAKAQFLRTLGHPVRIRVLELLCGGPMAVRDLLTQTCVKRSSLSQQLGVLRRAGIVASARESGSVVYSVAGSDVVALLGAAGRILSELAAEQHELLAQLREPLPPP